MKKRSAVLALLGLVTAAPVIADPAPFAPGELRGFHAKVRAALKQFGHLPELDGKYQIRVTEVTMDPGGGMGDHHHVGPGLRCMTTGEMEYFIAGKTTIYRAGDCFTETGDVTHTSRNIGKGPVTLLNFEILPASLPDEKGSISAAPK